MAKIINRYYLDWRDFDYYIHYRGFEKMYSHLNKKIEDILKSQKENKNKYHVNIITPGIETAVLVNKIASKYKENEFKIIAVKDEEFKFKFPVEYVRGDHRFISLIGCEYHDLFNKINEIGFLNTSICTEIDPAEQLRAGLIKR